MGPQTGTLIPFETRHDCEACLLEARRIEAKLLAAGLQAGSPIVERSMSIAFCKEHRGDRP